MCIVYHSVLIYVNFVNGKVKIRKRQLPANNKLVLTAFRDNVHNM